MILTIITINRNNAAGLERTMQSVAAQTRTDFEYVVVDGASTDGSQDVILEQAASFGERIKLISEPDGGIYSAMNKGIRMATGDYVQFLNSGDCLVSKDVVSRLLAALEENRFPSILYGNMLKNLSTGQLFRDRCFAGKEITLLGMFHGCLNHSPAYIRRSLFSKYGEYAEELRICSDWKWYMKAIVLGEEIPCYIDIDVSLFDMNGISESNKDLLNNERTTLLQEMIPHGILSDYNKWYDDIMILSRIKRYPLFYKAVKLLERLLFKIEKRNKEYLYNE